MKHDRPSFARVIVVLGLILQFVLTIVLIHRTTDLAAWLDGLRHGAGDVLGGAVALVFLLILIAPAWRGRRWALVISIFLQAGLTLGIVPYLVSSFSHPQDFAAWSLNVTYFDLGVVATIFGVIAAREAWGRTAPREWRSAQGAAVWAVVGTWVGMIAVGAAVAAVPVATGVMDQPAAEVVTLRMGLMSFQPNELRVRAGEPTAVVIVNESTESHSFDVDTLGIHVRVPGKSTAVALVQLPAGAPVPFYCGIPGHREAGMRGRLVAE